MIKLNTQEQVIEEIKSRMQQVFASDWKYDNQFLSQVTDDLRKNKLYSEIYQLADFACKKLLNYNASRGYQSRWESDLAEWSWSRYLQSQLKFLKSKSIDTSKIFTDLTTVKIKETYDIRFFVEPACELLDIDTKLSDIWGQNFILSYRESDLKPYYTTMILACDKLDRVEECKQFLKQIQNPLWWYSSDTKRLSTKVWNNAEIRDMVAKYFNIELKQTSTEAKAARKSQADDIDLAHKQLKGVETKAARQFYRDLLKKFRAKDIEPEQKRKFANIIAEQILTGAMENQFNFSVIPEIRRQSDYNLELVKYGRQWVTDSASLAYDFTGDLIERIEQDK